MKYTNNALNILIAKTYKGIGKAWIVKNVKGHESDEQLLALINGSLKDQIVTLDELIVRKKKCADFLEKMSGFADGVTVWGDPDFPPSRGNVKNSEQPVTLFYRGNLDLVQSSSQNIAVIGVLSPDPHTETKERQLVTHLVKAGACVVSGLAQGCDAIAHDQTLNCHGKTVAILPSPLSNILPAINKPLAEKIVASGGLLLSEYYDEPKAKMELNGRYQERDRLQALFSDAIILASSYAKNELGNDSGSRLAMGYALAYGIQRAVMYDEHEDANNPKYDLNRQILAEPDKPLKLASDLEDSVVSLLKIRPT
ncbi:MAG: DNA-protecting protein DprA [Gammaproteobacteria bacterium]|nr:DNA-protecting protein DprA [Gammaproteobacteria bacterium]